MTKNLDLADIQGNVIRAYGRFGYPKARYFFLHVHNAAAGRRFINAIVPHVTSAIRWKGSESGDYPGEAKIDRPDITFNIGFSYSGLAALELPTRTLKAMPAEFIDGMAERAHILSDKGDSARDHWDPIWKDNDGDKKVHIWISMNALVDYAKAKEGKFVTADLDAKTKWLERIIAQVAILEDKGGNAITDKKGTPVPGVTLLSGNDELGSKYQDASAVTVKTSEGEYITPEEHFGYRDGIGDPVFEGQFAPDIEAGRVPGRGKIKPDGSWAPLATGEFLLGHPDESQEIPNAALPPEFSHNGTFMAFRKLQEHVDRFEKYTNDIADNYASTMGIEKADAAATIKAKMVGRWSDGTPLVKAATEAEREEFRRDFEYDLQQANMALAIEMKREHGDGIAAIKERIAAIRQRETDFNYSEDPLGVKCPFSSHLRRGNIRDMLDPNVALNALKGGEVVTPDNGSALNKRRRILRRGLPYETKKKGKKGGDKGIIFMAVCANLFRQFEFLQQQWMQYGLDFQAGNDTCPVIGYRDPDFPGKFTIATDLKGDKPPFFCNDMPPFVTTRGGEYFFIPGITSLRMIAMGIVDPT